MNSYSDPYKSLQDLIGDNRNGFILFVINSISFKLARRLVANTIYSCFHTATSCSIFKELVSIVSSDWDE
ncbi:hypothetical protein RIR_jg42537.t1 [Rhizophagus irregularis DAOM 181602=DAOM 197198]|nr:hypothetical protein RIR_jg42537.t1 [Rhizophagus irregularis DAOM 181602=DAOM 197198]